MVFHKKACNRLSECQNVCSRHNFHTIVLPTQQSSQNVHTLFTSLFLEYFLFQALEWDGKTREDIAAICDSQAICQSFKNDVEKWKHLEIDAHIESSWLSENICLSPYDDRFIQRWKALQTRLGKIREWENAEKEKEREKAREKEKPQNSTEEQSTSEISAHVVNPGLDGSSAEDTSGCSTKVDFLCVVLIGVDNTSEWDNESAKELRMFISQRKSVIPLIFQGIFLPFVLHASIFAAKHASIKSRLWV
jgi:hypothetical protein